MMLHNDKEMWQTFSHVQVKLHPFFQATSKIGNRIDWKELMTSKAVFVPNSASREAPSEYFEEKPVIPFLEFQNTEHPSSGSEQYQHTVSPISS